MNGRRFATACIASAALLSLPSCGAPPPESAREVRFGARKGGPVVTQAELQDDLQRFTGDLFARLSDSTAPLQHRSVEVRDQALRLLLRQDSTALDIATGPTPEVNLLDMVVFVRLSRGVTERHWLSVFGEDGRALLDAWKVAEANLGAIEDKVLSDERKSELHALIDQWLERNPDIAYVESVRFAGFSQFVGALSAKSANETSGILGTVHSATRAADQAVLLAERFRFVATRAPFLLRVQARLGASEIMADGIQRLEEGAKGLPNQPGITPMLRDVSGLMKEGQVTASQTKETLTALQATLDRLPPPDQMQALLSSTSTLTEKNIAMLERAQRVLGQLDELMPKDPQTTASTITSVERRLDRVTKRGLAYLVALGAAWCILFWGGYVIARLVVSRRASLQR
jgi:hypothetical protein